MHCPYWVAHWKELCRSGCDNLLGDLFTACFISWGPCPCWFRPDVIERKIDVLRSAVYRLWYTVVVSENPGKRVPAIFFRTEAGGEPVREWLKRLPWQDDRRRIGYDVQTVEFGWPLGMPACRPLRDGIYEVRTELTQKRIARVLFYIDKLGRMVLLHGFIKKTRRTPAADLNLARNNKRQHERGLP